jgi:hypothetical protein
MNSRSHLARAAFVLVWAVGFSPALITAAGDKHPSVLFTCGLHNTYVTKPLHAEGIELNTCQPSELPSLLPTGKYNVVVLNGGLGDGRVVGALKAFMAEGGGVLVLSSHMYSTETEWLARQAFLKEFGATMPVVNLLEQDGSKVIHVPMCEGMFYTEDIRPPFNDGVKGVMMLNASPGSYSGMVPPVNLAITDPWKPILKAPETVLAVPFDKVTVGYAKPYLPKESEKAPVLLAVRDVPKGRLAALGVSPEWLLCSPANCPPVAAMLSDGGGGKPSNWIRLLANTFRYLAEPTLEAGKGGELTPQAVLNPDTRWKATPLMDWSKEPPIADQAQLPCLVGARSRYSGGKGSVENWVTAAKANGLKMLVFLEPLDSISREDFGKLKAECARFTNDDFLVVVGLRFQDAYGRNNIFQYRLDTQYPAPALLTEDGKFINNLDIKKTNGHQPIETFALEQNLYYGQVGYFRHAQNPLPPFEYKTYQAFVISSTENGRKVDDNFDDFAMMNANRFLLTPSAISILDDPAQIAQALRDDYLVICTGGIARQKQLLSESINYLEQFQYITRGPRILCWLGKNHVMNPAGQWFRPDQWRYQTRLHVVSDVGLKEIRLMSMGRPIRRFLMGGAKEFDRTFEWENSQERDLYPVVEDTDGHQAIGMCIRNMNRLWNEFICGDRCNYLCYGWFRTASGRAHQIRPCGNSVTQNKGCWLAEAAPAVSLTLDYPTVPVDGAPIGDRTPEFFFYPSIATAGYPDSLHVNCRPMAVLAGPDVVIGGGSLNFVAADPQAAGNAWSWWSPLAPNEFLEGYGLNCQFNAWPEGLRAGWYEFRLTARKNMPITDPDLPIQFTATPFMEFHDADGKAYKSSDTNLPARGSFKKGAYILASEVGGPAGLISLDDNLVYRKKGDSLEIGLIPSTNLIAQGVQLNSRFGYVGAPAKTDLAVLRDYFKLMSAPLAGVKVRQGKMRMDVVAFRFDGAQRGVDVRFPAGQSPAFRHLVIENLNENWDVWLLDRTRSGPNWRQLPMADGTAYAVLPGDVVRDVFLGHPVTSDSKDLKIQLSWTSPTTWTVEAHNPTDCRIRAKLDSHKGQAPFKFHERVDLGPGTSRLWQVSAKGTTYAAADR